MKPWAAAGVRADAESKPRETARGYNHSGAGASEVLLVGDCAHPSNHVIFALVRHHCPVYPYRAVALPPGDRKSTSARPVDEQHDVETVLQHRLDSAVDVPTVVDCYDGTASHDEAGHLHRGPVMTEQDARGGLCVDGANGWKDPCLVALSKARRPLTDVLVARMQGEQRHQ